MMSITKTTKECIFNISLNNKETVKVEFKPFNGLLVHFQFYGCVSETGYKSHFMYIADKVWTKYSDIKDIAKDIAQEFYNDSGYKYLNLIEQQKQLRLF